MQSHHFDELLKLLKLSIEKGERAVACSIANALGKYGTNQEHSEVATPEPSEQASTINPLVKMKGDKINEEK